MDKVAILIPTLNRSEFVSRQLRYYASVDSPHPIYIGDSSRPDHKNRIQGTIDHLADKISVKYYYWPEKNDRECSSSLADQVQEKYCAVVGDDDFLIPNSLTECAEFLSYNPKYRTSQGRAILIDLSGPYGNLKSAGPYWVNRVVEEENGFERILEFGKNYWVPSFSVHRTNEFVEDSSKYRMIQDKKFGELLHSYTFLAKGKSMFIDSLHLIRQAHPSRYVLPDVFDWITSHDWNSSYQYFMDTLTNYLIEVDAISKEKASEFVKQSLWAYLAGGLYHKYEGKYGGLLSSGKAKEQITRNQALNSIKRNINVFKNKIINSKNQTPQLLQLDNKNELSLPFLLNPSTPYHKDFLPVYKIITNETLNKT